MVVIAGCIVRKGNKILMVKEAKKKCYGQWNYPAGHMEEGEKITRGIYEKIVDGLDRLNKILAL